MSAGPRNSTDYVTGGMPLEEGTLQLLDSVLWHPADVGGAEHREAVAPGR